MIWADTSPIVLMTKRATIASCRSAGPTQPSRQNNRTSTYLPCLGVNRGSGTVPIMLLDAIIWTLATLEHVIPALSAKAELARIGRY